MMNNESHYSCLNCSFENPIDAEFCQSCGQALMRTCSKCGTQNGIQATFCKRCGTELEASASPEAEIQLHKLSSSTPKDSQEKTPDGKAGIEGERKPVTILFADIVGSTSHAEKLDPEEWKEIVQGAHSRVIEAVHRYEGTIAQLLGDGVLAFFGAPITHEDDPIRAVRSALDIQQSIGEYGRELAGYVDDFQMRIGINTGEVVIGDIGTELHVEYLAIGDAVNIASRVESAARPGGVLLSEDCARLTRAEFELKSKGKITIKGKDEPLQVFEVIGIRESPESLREVESPRTAYVGREDELEKLQSALVSLSQGHGQVVIVLGEAGIGKSRLLEEGRARAAHDFNLTQRELGSGSFLIPPSSIRWLEGRSLSYGSSLTLWAVSQILLSDLGLNEGAPEARIKVALRRRVNALFPDEGAEVLPFLGLLLGLKPDGAQDEVVRSLSGEGLRHQTFAAVSDYFLRVAEEEPTVLTFEDMHWADPTSLKAVENLIALTDQVPLMILGLARAERDHDSWRIKLQAETDFSHRYTEIHLKRLSKHDSAQFVDQLVSAESLAEDTRGLVMERSEGNPLYLEEVVRDLVERELMGREGDAQLGVEGGAEFGIPDTLQGVLLARIDRLEEGPRQTLQLASVIGRSFPYSLLQAISDPKSELDKQLSRLQRADLVRERARLPELEYIFKHTMTQEAAYNSLLIERRKEYHCKVGEAIERLFEEHSEEFIGLLAHHWERGGDPVKATKYLLRAGAWPRELHAHQETLGYVERALEMTSLDSEGYFPVLLQRAQVLLDLFRGKQAVADFGKILAFAHEKGDQLLELEALLGLGRGHYIIALDEPVSDSPARSLEYYETAYSLAKQLADKAGMIKALVPTVWFDDFWPEYQDQARANAQEAFDLSVELGDDDLLLDSKLADFYTSPLKESVQLGNELQEKLEARQDLTRLNYLLFGLMWRNLRYGNFERAIESCDKGILVAKQMGVPPVQYPTLKALALLRLGRFDEARRSLEEEVADEEHRLGRAFKAFGYGVYYLELMDYDRAEESLTSSIDQAGLIGRTWLQNAGRAELVRSLIESANDEVEGLTEIGGQLEGVETPSAELALGRLASREGNYSGAIVHADRVIALTEVYGHQPDVTAALLLKSRAYLELAQYERAHSVAKEGVELAADRKNHPVLWRAHVANAEALNAMGASKRSEAQLAEAEKVLKEIAGNISDQDQRDRFESAVAVSRVIDRAEESAD